MEFPVFSGQLSVLSLRKSGFSYPTRQSHVIKK